MSERAPRRAEPARSTASAAAHPPAGPPATGPAHVAFVLTQVGALAAMGFAEQLAPLGLTPAHAGLLRAVAADPGRSQQAVATELGVLPSRLVVLVDGSSRTACSSVVATPVTAATTHST